MSKRPRRTFLSLSAVLTVALSSTIALTAQAPRSIGTGTYTDAQARAGEVLYQRNCAQCHGDDLAGVEQAPALAGPAFNQAWNGATLKKLLERIETMPPDRPKLLTTKQYVEVLAYLLSTSDAPAGTTPLSDDRSILAGITFTSARPTP